MKYIAVLCRDMEDFENFIFNLDSNFSVNRAKKETVGHNGFKFLMANNENSLMTVDLIGLLVTPGFYMVKDSMHILKYAFTRVRH